jgi:hypothetical protein
VLPTEKLEIVPDESAGNVCDSFVKNAVIDDSPCFDLARVIVLVKLTLADFAVKLIDPESTVNPVTVILLLELVAVTPVELEPVNVKLDVTFSRPKNTIISVVPEEKSETVPSEEAGNV